MNNRNKLSIYLIKEEITEPEDIFKNFEKVIEFKKYGNNGTAYFLPSYIHDPKWLKDFFNEGHQDNISQSSSRMVLLKKINYEESERIFALTFGYSKYMFEDDILEEQFGLKIILNSINDDQIRRISKTSIGTNLKQSNEQLPRTSTVFEFGFDINKDLMKNISGKSDEEMFESCILTGGDVLSVSVERDIDNIDEFLVFCYKKYKETTYVRHFSWIDNIKYVKDKSVIENLNYELINGIKNEDYNNIWMAVPEVVNWENIKDFKITGLDETLDDLDIKTIIDSLKNDLDNISQLKNKKIIARSITDDTKSEYEWNSYNCIIAEIDYNSNSYCLNGGKWYKINKDFVTDVNTKYSNIQLLQTDFLDYDKSEFSCEDDYNENLVNNLNNSYLIHKYKLPIGGGQGNNIEPCDVFWNKKFIHIKKNGSSSQLSHLFNQALVSCQVFLDSSSREKFRDKFTGDGNPDIIPEPYNSQDYEIIIGIINKFDDDMPRIPFFSKVTICNIADDIQKYGYTVKLKNIKAI